MRYSKSGGGKPPPKNGKNKHIRLLPAFVYFHYILRQHGGIHYIDCTTVTSVKKFRWTEVSKNSRIKYKTQPSTQ